MSRLLKPVINEPVAASEGQKDDRHDRILKYIPLEIAGAFPMVMSAIEQRVALNKPALNLSPLHFAWGVFGIFLVADLLLVHRGYKKTIPKPARNWIEIPHLLIHIVAFLIWTYDIRAVIWSDLFDYDPLVVIVLTAAFAVFAVFYQPTISREVAEQSGLIPPSEEKPDAGGATSNPAPVAAPEPAPQSLTDPAASSNTVPLKEM